MDGLNDGFYSKTCAFNFLKKKLGIPKSALINKNFFDVFFEEAEVGKYLPRCSEEDIEKIFLEKKIPQLNEEYYKKKRYTQREEAKRIAEEVLSVAQESIAQLVPAA